MKQRHTGNGFDLSGSPDPQVGPPLMIAEQGVMIRTDITRRANSRCGLVEHTEQRSPIDIASMHVKVDDAPGELIHDNQDPMSLEENGLAPKQFDASKAVLHMHMADEG